MLHRIHHRELIQLWAVVLGTLGSQLSAQDLWGPNLLVNGGFEQIASNGKPTGWSDNGFSVDRSVFRSGAVSFRLQDAHLIAYSQSASQQLALKKGTYRIGGWVRKSRLAATRGSGVRICLQAPPSYPWTVSACTAIVKGTGDWEYLGLTDIVVPEDSTARFSLQAYGEPDGTAWFDDLILQQKVPDTTPPTISNIAAAPAGDGSVKITWTTNEAADEQVEYGLTTAYGSLSPLVTTLRTAHAVTLSGLSPATTYHFRVKSRDAAGNLAVSADGVFTTPDTVPPVITGPVASSVTESTAQITWSTDEPSDGQVEYGLTTSYGSLSPVDAGLSIAHSITLTGLAPDTLYHCRVRSRDAAGNTAVSADMAFRTAPIAGRLGVETGGLTAYPVSVIGPNLLSNPGFETPGSNGKPLGWSDNGFQTDTTTAHSGSVSFRLTDAYLIPYAQSASQQVALRKGIYEFSGWVKTSSLAATRGSGVRICLTSDAGGACTSIVKGTADWQKLSVARVAIAQDVTARIKLEAYAEPDGTAWFDDIELRRHQFPLSVFLLYPNYRGVLFDDQSLTARFEVSVDPPQGSDFSAYQVEAVLTDTLSGQVLRRTSYPAAAVFTAALDFSAFANDRAYQVSFRLLNSSKAVVFEYPAYRIWKAPGSLRQNLTISFDQNNRILLRGRPSFLLGVYDSGLSYKTSESAWEQMFNDSRRLFELPINLYLNYWYGEAPNSSILPMLNVLQQKGIYGLTNANCFDTKTVEQTAPYWFLTAPESDIQARAAHGAFAGFYAADECKGYIASNVFGHYQRMKTLDADGISLGVLLGNSDLALWPDAVDLLATDPYPLWGAEPASGYALNKVGEWTRLACETVRRSRPVATVLQFFKATSNSRWPTRSELRNMSYMAIAEGANGLLYWSLGANALAYVCSGWCDEKVEYFGRLKSVIEEIKALEPALVSLDRPDLLTGNSNAAIRTRVKFSEGKAYLIAYNSTGDPATATFTWSFAPLGVSVYGESRALAPSGAGYTDSFGPYEAHVYVVTR